MEADHPSVAQSEDNSQRADGSGANVRISLIGADSRLLIATAVAVCVLCAFYAFETGRQLAQFVYWMQREEAFIEQLSAQGYHVPPDILEHIKKEHEK